MMRARQHPAIASAVELARLRSWREVWVTSRQCCFSLGGATRLLVDAWPGGPVSASLSFQPDAKLGLETPEALASEIRAQLVSAALAAAPQRVVS
jgi:hypothetical protein